MPLFRKTPVSNTSGIILSDEQKLDWLRLIRTKNVGPITFRELINRYGSAAHALEALPQLSLRGGKKSGSRIFERKEAQLELAKAKRFGAKLVALGEADYPSWLTNIASAPPLLYIKGDYSLAQRPAVAIVGSRNSSALGQKYTRFLATELGQEDIVICSGLARGIDTAAHHGALERGTIAVIAGGMDIFYPPENEALQKQISETGLLVSENPPGFKPRAQDFPRRNRLISGISMATIVIEAGKRSGSLITARMAAEQGRDVLAVPGHPLDPRAEGPNSLLRQGAILVTKPDDILEVIAPLLDHPPKPPTLQAQEEPDWDSYNELENVNLSDRERLASSLSHTAVDIDEIVRATQMPVSTVRAILLELDLAGRLERHGSHKVAWKE